MDELSLYQKTLLLSNQMLSAIENNDLKKLLELSKQREPGLNKIYNLLAEKKDLSAEHTKVIQSIISVNDEVVMKVQEIHTSMKGDLLTMKRGKHALDTYNK